MGGPGPWDHRSPRSCTLTARAQAPLQYNTASHTLHLEQRKSKARTGSPIEPEVVPELGYDVNWIQSTLFTRLVQTR